MANKINRRKFFKDATLATAGAIAGSEILGCTPSGKPSLTSTSPYPLMQEVMKYRKIDAHAHVGIEEGNLAEVLDFADRLGIEKFCVSKPITNYSGKEPEDPGVVRAYNDIVMHAVKQHPDRLIGYFTLNPRYPKESLEEIERCVDMGMLGYKGYTQVKISDPLYYPVIEKLIDHKLIVFMHAFCQIGMGGYRMKYDIGKWYNTSIPEDFVEISKKYPEAIFQFAHIGGGGDWEYECKMLKDSPNVYVDTSGSNNEEHMIDFAIQYLGEDRLFFGTDMSFYQGVGKIFASNLTESQKRKIFYGNYQNAIKKLGRNVM